MTCGTPLIIEVSVSVQLSFNRVHDTFMCHRCEKAQVVAERLLRRPNDEELE